MTIKGLLKALAGAGSAAGAAQADRGSGALEALAEEVSRVEADLDALTAAVARQRELIERLVEAQAAAIIAAADLAALPSARLRTTTITIDGSPRRRSGIVRREIGQAVTLPLRPWMGVTALATPTADVRALWEGLLAAEARSPGQELRGVPSTVLEFEDAVVAKRGVLHVSLSGGGNDRPSPARHLGTVIVPRFTHAFLKRKLRNVGHWLLDCVPHLLALDPLAPEAVFLLPPLPSDVHWAVLSLVGIPRERVLIWDGAPIACDRLLAQETEGRLVRGRPLPAMLEMRRRLLAQAPGPTQGSRRIYVSRRDAVSNRQWVANEMAVEELFERHGFERLVMAAVPLDEQVRIFRSARVVAGVSGAGLADIVFANPGTHVVTLLSDSLIRWYADQAGARSRWVLAKESPLSALSDSPRFYAHLAAACEQHSHMFVAEDEMPLDGLDNFVGEVLARVERG